MTLRTEPGSGLVINRVCSSCLVNTAGGDIHGFYDADFSHVGEPCINAGADRVA